MTGSSLVVRHTSVYTYRNELVVELTARDREGDLVVVSYQFEYAGENGAVSPKQPVEDSFEDIVSEALAEHDYRWV